MRTIIRIEVSKTKANVAVATNLVVVKELTLSLDALGFNELTYFAHPYTSSERGTNEVHNRMIRQDLPKGLSLDAVSPAQVAWTQARLNNLPRRLFGYQTPAERFQTALGSK